MNKFVTHVKQLLYASRYSTVNECQRIITIKFHELFLDLQNSIGTISLCLENKISSHTSVVLILQQ